MLRFPFDNGPQAETAGHLLPSENKLSSLFFLVIKPVNYKTLKRLGSWDSVSQGEFLEEHMIDFPCPAYQSKVLPKGWEMLER